MANAKYCLFISTDGLCGYYCGFWTQYWGMEQYPVIIEEIDDNSSYQSKNLKTYSSYGRALHGAKSCYNNIGCDWCVKIVDLENPENVAFNISIVKKGKYRIKVPGYDINGNPINDSLSW